MTGQLLPGWRRSSQLPVVELDGLLGELRAEKRAFLPLEVDGERITLSGIIDLVHVTDDVVEIIDFKTDLSWQAESEYRIQLSVYYHILKKWFSDRPVAMSIFYTAEDTRVEIDPLSRQNSWRSLTTNHKSVRPEEHSEPLAPPERSVAFDRLN